MKRGGPRHQRTIDLAEDLGVPLYAAVGLLEMLWHFAAEFTPRGDIGRFPNRHIGRALAWTGDPDLLIASLVGSGWLEESSGYRLLVHSWAQHADNGVRACLRKRGEDFIAVLNEDETSGCDSVHSRNLSRRGARGEGLPLFSSSGSSSGVPEQPACHIVPLFPVAREEDGPADFAVFWEAYPKRTKRAEAERAWAQLKPTRGLLRVMLEALGWQKLSPEWLKDSRQYVPNGASWLNGRRWEDEPVDIPEMSETAATNAHVFQRFRERMRDADRG